MAEKNELLVEHYHKTFDLTTRLWEQRNRLFLLLIGVIGLSAILTFRGSEANPLFLDMIIKTLGITDANRITEIRQSFPFALLHGVLLLVVFYLMFNLYHRALSVLTQYAYLGSLEKEIRESLNLQADTKAFTRESEFYWGNRPGLMSSVKWVYMTLLGLLLLAFLIGRLLDDYHSGNRWLVLIDLVVSVPTIVYFFGYALSSVGLDSKEAIVPKTSLAKTPERKNLEDTMSDGKPVGSGYFALVSGVLFLFAFIGSFFIDRAKLDPYVALQVWLVFSAAILVVWGGVRVRTGNGSDYRIGQETLNFVVAIAAATFAIIALIK